MTTTNAKKPTSNREVRCIDFAPRLWIQCMSFAPVPRGDSDLHTGGSMASNNVFSICVLPGDGIGIEVMAPTIAVLQRAAARVGGFDLRFEEHRAGAFAYRDTGTALSDATLDAARRADA